MNISRSAVGCALFGVLTSSLMAQGSTVFTFQDGLDGYAGTRDTFIANFGGNSSKNNGSSTFLTWELTPSRQWFQFQDQSGGYAGTSDTSISLAAPTTDAGNYTYWGWDTDVWGTSYSAWTLMRFDGLFGSGVSQIPPGATVYQASLEYDCYNTGDWAQVHKMNSTWSESVTWNTFSFDYDPAVTALAYGTSKGTCDLTQSVQAISAGTPNHGWVFRPLNDEGVEAWSSENSTESLRPRLRVYADAENTSYSLMRFDGIVGNGTLQVPAGSTVQSATLSYEIVDLGDDANLHEMASSWSESVTWDQFQSFSYLPNPIAIAPGGVFQASCDVTQSVQAYVDGSPNYGWVFVSTGNDSVTTYSRERNIQSWRPSLVVTFVAPSDCNGNGIDDQTDIANGTSTDCNANFIPDECEIASNPGLDWNGDGTLDECSSPNYCTANPNSTGQIAVMSALGSPIITDNNFTLTASQMPTFEWGYFLMAASQGFIPNVGGSGGNLCLGFPFYRFSKFPTGQIISSGAGGTFSFSPNLLNLPQGVVFMIGETWDFQAWYRDGAASTSNFTDGIEVMFR